MNVSAAATAVCCVIWSKESIRVIWSLGELHPLTHCRKDPLGRLSSVEGADKLLLASLVAIAQDDENVGRKRVVVLVFVELEIQLVEVVDGVLGVGPDR